MMKLERVYLTHRYLLAKHNVSVIWTESPDHRKNCGVLTASYPQGRSAAVDQLAQCCATMSEWPVSNAVHDTMWAPKNKHVWLEQHHDWLQQQCTATATAAAAGGADSNSTAHDKSVVDTARRALALLLMGARAR